MTRQPFTLLVIDPPPNRPPVFTSAPMVDAYINRNYVYQAQAKDADGETVTFSFASVPPIGLTIDSTTGDLTWKPNGTQLGTFDVVIEATDSRGEKTQQQFKIQTQSEPGNLAPIITSEPTLKSAANEPYLYQVQAIDPDNHSLTYSLLDKPPGMTIDPKLGRIRWVPQTNQVTANPYTVTVQVQDDQGGTDTQTFAIEVSSARPGRIYGTVFNDVDGNGIRGSNGNGEEIELLPLPDPSSYPSPSGNPHYAHTAGFPFIPLELFTPIAPGVPTQYSDSYQLYDIGATPSIDVSFEGRFFGMQFRADDPNTLYRVSTIWESGRGYGAALVEQKVKRGLGDHIIGFEGTPKFTFLPTSDVSGGFDISPDGVLFISTSSSSTNYIFQYKSGSTTPDKVTDVTAFSREGFSTLKFVPEGFPEAGSLKALGSRDPVTGAGAFKTILLTPDGAGTYNIEGARPEATVYSYFYSSQSTMESDYSAHDFAYLPSGSPGIDSPSLTFLNHSLFNYDIDSNSNPIPSPQVSVVGAGLAYSWKGTAVSDPLTGDLLIHSSVYHIYSSSPPDRWPYEERLLSLRGFTPSNPRDPGLEGWVVYIDQNSDGQRNSEESFTYTDERGNYSFSLDPGTYTIGIETKTNWTLNSPASSRHTVSLTNGQMVNGRQFGVIRGTSTNADNQAPQFTGQPPKEITTPGRLRYRLAATDADGDALTYDLLVKPEGMALDDNGLLVWKPTINQIGTHDVILRVQDGRGGVDILQSSIAVKQANTAPTFESFPSAVLTATQGVEFQYQFKAYDLEGDSVTFSLEGETNGAEIDPKTGRLTWTPPGSQNYTLTVAAIDSQGRVNRRMVDFQVSSGGVNTAPQITSTPPSKVTVGQPYFYQMQAIDPQNDALRYTIESNRRIDTNGPDAPLPLILDARTGRLTGQPLPTQVGQYEIVLKATDGRGGEARQTLNLNVTSSLQRQNQSPIISSTPRRAATVDRLYEYNLESVDPDNDWTFLELQQAPTGMEIDSEQGTIRWIPNREQIGQHAVTVSVLDSQGNVTTQSFEVRVRSLNVPPQILSSPVTQAALGKRYFYAVQANDTETSKLTYRLETAPGSGTTQMQIDRNTGVIDWTVPVWLASQDYSVTVVVEDEQGGIVRQSYKLAIGETSLNLAPVITSRPIQAISSGTEYLYQVSATDPDGATGSSLQYELQPNAFPNATTISATGQIRWQNPVAGTHSVTVLVKDNQGGVGRQTFTLNVRANQAPIVEALNPQQAVVRIPYRFDIKATDVDNDRLSYTLEQPPDGMQIDELGRITWLPANAEAGQTRTVDVVVTDAYGATTERSYQLSVVRDEAAPLVQVAALQSQAQPNGIVTFIVAATDNVQVENLILKVNGQAVEIDASGRATINLRQPQWQGVSMLSAVAEARDAANNLGQSQTIEVPVIQFNPTLSLESDEVMVTSAIDLRGSVAGTGVVRYTLEVFPAEATEEAPALMTIRGDGTASGVLGKLDPTLLENGSYMVRLTAYDYEEGTAGQASFTESTINVVGNLKLGNFRLSFTDLAIPVTGIPISLTRTYDTLTANTSDDFGYGWRMEFRDTDLRTSLRRDLEMEDLGYYTGFRDGTKVFITLPGGKRETFTFQPIVNPELQKLRAPIPPTALFYNPRFVSEKGSTMTLSVNNAQLLYNAETGEYHQVGFAYNPADPYFGGAYTLTTQDGTQYRIDAKTGDLLTVKDTNGNTLTYTDSAITSSTGQKITFDRNAAGQITAVKDPMGELMRYDYDANGDLVKVTDQEQNVTQFVYDSTYDDPAIAGVNDGGRSRKAHYLREVIDPLNRSGARLDYDPVTGRLIKTTNAAGQTIETSYDPENSIQVIKDAAGNSTEYEYDSRGNVVRQTNALGHSTWLKYDDDNNVIESKDAIGIVTKYECDSRNNLASKTEGYCGCAGVIPGKTYYTYDGFGNMTNLVLPSGASMVMSYDNNGQMLAMKDGKGNVIQSYTYYDNGLVKTETDTSGTSQYFYDDLGNLTKSLDSDGSVTLMKYDFNGNLKEMTEDNGTPNDLTDDEVSTFTYDKLGREKLADYGEGIWVKYDYEGAGGDWTKLEAPTIGKMERKLTPDGKLAGWITPDGGTPTFIYDSAGRLWKETDSAGVVTTEYTYDQIGRVSSVKDVRTGAIASKQYDADNRVTEEVDPLLGFVKYEYYGAAEGSKLKSTTRGQHVRNAAGELVVDTTVATQTTTFEYNGLRTTVIDAQGRRTTSVMDEYSLPIETLFENRNGKTYRTSQSYLYANNLQEAKDYPTRIVDIGGNDRTYTYDTTGRLKTATDLGDGVYDYTYGKDGLALISSPLSQRNNGTAQETITYEYDDLNNLKSVKYSDSLTRSMSYRETDNRLGTVTLANGESITYDYNAAGQMTTQTGTGVGTTTMTYTADGAIRTVTDSTGTTTYTYDLQTKQLSRIDNSNGSSIVYTYDLAGRVKTQTEWGNRNSTGYTTEYSYDTFGNLKTVKDPVGGMTTMTYDTLNRMTSRIMPNGVTTTWTYDDLDRVASVTHRNTTTGEVLTSVTYERQGVGEPTKITREDGSYTKLQYDTALRVTKESFYNAQNVLIDETTYVYDAAGKRIGKITATGNQTYNYDKGYQLDNVTGTSPEDYAYDANGRMDLIQRDGQTLDLDHDVYDRLTSVRSQTGSATNYVYDGQGRRVTATNGSEMRTFLVAPVMGGGLDSTDMMLDGSGNMVSNYVYAGGSSPFMRIDANGNPVYYLTDGMGSVIGLADGAGASAAKFAYDSFGNVRSQSGTLAIANNAGGDFRFQGQWLESATGIYHFRARDYDSKTGTFLSRDPVAPTDQQPEALNPYQFAYGNPLIYSDPTGGFTLTELNAAQNLQTALASARTYAGSQAKEYLKEKIGEAFSETVASVFNYFVPGTSAVGKLLDTVRRGESLADDYLENLVKGVVCEYFEGIPLLDNLRLYPRVLRNGTPQSPGYGCGQEPTDEKTKKKLESLPGSKPEFIFINGNFSTKNPNSFLIGDIKLTQRSAADQVLGNDNQWQAMSNYAREYQLLPFVSYLSLIEAVPGGHGVSKSDRQKMAEVALKQNVILVLANLID